jgi:hypothetical protein
MRYKAISLHFSKTQTSIPVIVASKYTVTINVKLKGIGRIETKLTF